MTSQGLAITVGYFLSFIGVALLIAADTRDIFILAIYSICVYYIIYDAIFSLEQQFTVTFSQDLLNPLLENTVFAGHSLKDLVGIKINFKDRYKLDELKDIAIVVENKSDHCTVYLDWDYSSITDLAKQPRRVIRVRPGVTFDLFQPQVFTIVAPKQTLKSTVVVEEMFTRKTEDGVLAVDGLLIDIVFLNREKASKDEKKRFADFINEKASLEFALRLALRVFDPLSNTESHRYYLPCDFKIVKVNWRAFLPWNKKKK